MSVIDLKRRITHDVSQYRTAIHSDCSLIFVDPIPTSCDEGSVDLSVGDRIFDAASSEPREIPESGLVLSRGQAIVVYTKEMIYMPLNVFGLLSGKGSLIYHGIFVSPGKVDPGFQDRLRIGLLNASKKSLLLTRGMPICSCTFIQMETTLSDSIARHTTEPVRPKRPSYPKTLLAFCGDQWKWILTTVIATIAATAAIIRALR